MAAAHDLPRQVTSPFTDQAHQESGADFPAAPRPPVRVVLTPGIESRLEALGGLSIVVDIGPEPVAAPNAVPNIFHRRDDLWQIVFKGDLIPARNEPGMAYVAYALQNPNQRVDYLQIAGILNGNRGSPILRGEIFDDLGGQGDSGLPNIDDVTKAKVEDHIAEIDDMLSEPGDPEGKERLEVIRHQLVEYLRKQVGLNGRIRESSSSVQKIRRTAQRRVQRARITFLKKDSALGTGFGHHLKACLKIEPTCCVYLPEAGAASWDVRLS